jgi:23S rRNA pseudouridine1911/1915/1917 synthase
LNETVKAWTVPPATARVRLDRYLLQLLPGQSRSQIQSWIRKGLVRVNDLTAKTGHPLRPRDRISLRLPEPEHDQPHPEALPLNILYQDPDLAVVEKPAGMVCHLGAGVHSGTLVNALLYRLGSLNTGDPMRPGIVHRLDKLTSGVMVVAKNLRAHRGLAQQFRSREVIKEYLALVFGRPDPSAGTIALPLGRDPRDRKKISVRARKARTAITHYSTLKQYKGFTLLTVRIETGRTHQIRVHLAQKGYPVVGDSVYGTHRRNTLPQAEQQEIAALNRVFLHARRLEFRHPQTGEWLSFTSPLPPELEYFLARLGFPWG